jgi:hypothetical protein
MLNTRENISRIAKLTEENDLVVVFTNSTHLLGDLDDQCQSNEAIPSAESGVYNDYS